MTSANMYKLCFLLLGAQAVAGASSFRRRSSRRRDASETPIQGTCASVCVEQYDRQEFSLEFGVEPEFDMEYCGVGWVVASDKLDNKVDSRDECKETCCVRQEPDEIRCAEHALQPTNNNQELCYFADTVFDFKEDKSTFAMKCSQRLADDDSCSKKCCKQATGKELCELEVQKLTLESVCKVYETSVLFSSDNNDPFGEGVADLTPNEEKATNLKESKKEMKITKLTKDDKDEGKKSKRLSMYNNAGQREVSKDVVKAAKKKSNCKGNWKLADDEEYKSVYDSEIKFQKKRSEILFADDELEVPSEVCPVANVTSIKDEKKEGPQPSESSSK